ncbi:MAG: bifunctional diguanylate cyclase/phosphodiesterase [Xanthobacteraceae bacterium]|nr:bifunctional diguanylate cyclase/phosphodiesterase [Xanthobacteraceae bacterium]
MHPASEQNAGGTRHERDDVLSCLGQVAFTWDIVNDDLSWSGDVAALFRDIPQHVLGKASDFATMIEPQRDVRRDAIMNGPAANAGNGVHYQIEYGLRARTSGPLVWIEETGCWFVGADGRPSHARGILRPNAERHAREQQLRKLTQDDPLTGAFNRTHLIAALAETLEEASRFRSPFAFMLVGIDDLAQLNEAFGFDVADEVITEVAHRIRARLRNVDVLGRFSGNKFGLVLKNCTADDMQIAAERFLAGIRDEVVPTKLGPVSLTASIGAISLPRHGRSTEEVTSRAQEALDTAKSRRRGSFMAWRPNVERETQRQVNIRVTDEIVTALNERRIVLAFEPVVHASTLQPAFHECLVRMRRGEGDLSLAPDIVPVAEKLGLIRLVDHRVLELVVAELTASPHIELSLNISPETTMDPNWWSGIESLFRAHPGVAERVIVEITETVAIRDLDDVRGFVTRLKNFGARIAIDDFGAGYTSFRNLRKLGVDIVKIDGAFVQNVVRSADDRAFVQSMIDLARRLDLKTVAEWVQDDEAAQLLHDWGCDYLQGRLIGLATPNRPWLAELPPVRALA